MKSFIRNVVLVVFSFIVLVTCQNPFASNEKEEEGNFVITIGSNDSSRSALYPPNIPGVSGTPPDGAPELKNLKFSVTFTPIPSGTPTTIEKQGSLDIKGKLAQGNYVVTMEVKWGADPYAKGCAIDNPVKINSGNNTVKVWVFSVDDAEMPLISEKPQGAAYAVNSTATALKVTATVDDGGDLTYQWYKKTTAPNQSADPLGKLPSDSTPITGETSASYTPPTATLGTTYYYVEVTNTNGGNETTITSGPAAVVVNNDAQTPNITTQPSNVSISTNGAATLTVAASVTDGGSLSYQWYRNTTASNTGGTLISGATSASYTTPSLKNGAYHYYCVIKNTNNSAAGNKVVTVSSNVAMVTVTSASGGGGGDMAWTAVGDSTFSYVVYAIAYGNGKFVAGDSSGKMAYSADGITWTAVTDSKFGTTTITGIAYGGGKFVAVGDDGKMAWSAD